MLNSNVYEGDAIATLQQLLREGRRWDYCLTSPPYFGQVDYEIDGQYGLEKSVENYIDTQRKVFQLVYDGLQDGGIAWVVIGDTSNNYSPVRAKGQRRGGNGAWHYRRRLQRDYREKEPLNVPFRLLAALREDGWIHRKTLIWDKGQSGQVGKGDAPGECHEFVLMIGKYLGSGRPYFHTLPLKSTVLSYSPAKHPTHPCPFPLELARELLRSCTIERAHVLDPYVGMGTTWKVCSDLGLHCIGIDLCIPSALRSDGILVAS